MNTDRTHDQVLQDSRDSLAQMEVNTEKASVPVLAMILIGLKAARCTARLRGETEKYAKINEQVEGCEAAFAQADKELREAV
jgi:hypothetical protein